MIISFKAAVKALQNGRVVALPTETVYGLAACIEQPEAVGALFSLKKRPASNPLIIHCASQEQITQYLINPPPHFSKLAETFWPGPMTLVMPVNCALVPATVRAGLPTAAFRIPSHPSTRSLIEETGPLVMPSANLSGKPSATTAEHVKQDFGDDFPVFDGGACSRGVESTILYWDGSRWELARLGALAPSAFFPILGHVSHSFHLKPNAPICPGQFFRHYAPQAQLILLEDALSLQEGVLIGFSDRCYPIGCRIIALSSASDAESAARNLYECLRQLDQEGVQQAYVDMHIPDEGLWLTIKERLRKAAAK